MNGNKRRSGLMNAQKPTFKGKNAQKSLFISGESEFQNTLLDLSNV